MTGYSLIYLSISILFLIIISYWKGGLKASTIFSAFCFGILIAPVAGGVSILFKNTFIPNEQNISDFHLNHFFLYFLIIGPIEELSKFLAAFITILKKKDFVSSSDGLIIGISSALGFACIENILYLFSFGLNPTLPRLILGNLGHAAYSIFWGYSMGVVFNENASFSLLIISLIMASVLHGMYNFLLSFSFLGAITAIFFSFILYFLMFLFLGTEKARNKLK